MKNCLFALCLLISTAIQNLNDDFYTKRELHAGETNVTLLNTENMYSYINATTPILVFFTSEHCVDCISTDFQAVILADNYKRSGKQVRIGVFCVRENEKLAKELGITVLSTIRLYYRGLYLTYHHYGEDFKLMNLFVEGKLDFKEIFHLKSKNMDIYKKHMKYKRHCLLYYGYEPKKFNKRLQIIMRLLYFRFGEHFVFFHTKEKEIGDELGLIEHTLYEYNKYDNRYRPVEINHLFEGSTLNMTAFHNVAHEILVNSYPKVSNWNPSWMRVHPSETITLFYSNLRNSTSEMVFNSTCSEKLYKHTRCMLFDVSEFEKNGLNSVYHIPIESLPDPSVIELKQLSERRQTFVLDLTQQNLTNTVFEEFYFKTENNTLEEFHHLSEEEPEDNDSR